MKRPINEAGQALMHHLEALGSESLRHMMIGKRIASDRDIHEGP